LSRRNDLGERTALLQLRILVYKESDIDMLAEVICNDEALGGV
jgi:hypothetical protein